MSLQAIKYTDNQLQILDQLQLPFVEKYIPIQSAQDGWHAIKEMRVRGAPAIAIVAILSLAVELNELLVAGKLSPSSEEVGLFIIEKLDYLVTSRPTAVNLADAASKFERTVNEHVKTADSTGQTLVTAYLQEAELMLVNDLSDNQNIGAWGAKWILERATSQGQTKVNVLTHCNTGFVAYNSSFLLNLELSCYTN
jgi:methylthioribose-1-phosphate isomerase